MSVQPSADFASNENGRRAKREEAEVASSEEQGSKKMEREGKEEKCLSMPS